MSMTNKQRHESESAAKFIQAIWDSIQNHLPVFGEVAFPIGKVERRMAKFAKDNNIELASDDIYMNYDRIAHATRQHKRKIGIDVGITELKRFPLARLDMDLYYDTLNKNFVYTDYKTKYIISPSYEIKINKNRVMKVAFVTACGNIDATDFYSRKYKKI